MGRRHQATIAKLNRNTKGRQSLFKTQLNQLIELGSISTTVTKAKIIKRLFDRLSAKATDGTLSSRRRVAADLSNSQNANRLIDLIIPAMGGRQSGFTTIQKTGLRRGDSTITATLSLVVPLPQPAKPTTDNPVKVKNTPIKKSK